MKEILTFYFPMFVIYLPVIFFIFFGNMKILFKTNYSILQLIGFTFILGIMTPFIAMFFSTIFTVGYLESGNKSQCLSHVLGYIGFGMQVEFKILPVLSLCLVLINLVKTKLLLHGQNLVNKQ